MSGVGQQRGGVPDHARDRFSHDEQGVQPNRYGKHRAVTGAMMVMVVAGPMAVTMPMGMTAFGGMAVIMGMIVPMIVGMHMIDFVVVACAHYIYP